MRNHSRCTGAVVATLAMLMAGILSVSATLAAQGPLVFAAASMKTGLDAIAADFARKTGAMPVISYGSSGTLAKQLEAGAPADLFISADEKWMGYLEGKNIVDKRTRENLLGNSLVLIAHAPSELKLQIKPGVDLAAAIGDGELAVCFIASCPAGIYAKEALQKLGIFTAVEPKLAQADNVRAALLLVARGEAKLGIVYATDAKAEPHVAVVDTFPADTHSPILYPVARTVASKNPLAADFQAFLRSPQAVSVLKQQGFTILPAN